MIARFGYDDRSQVIEIASNDGYLLQYFRAAEHPRARRRAGGERGEGGRRNAAIPTLVKFFGVATARSARRTKGRRPT